jgi:hypothetical protein
LRLGCAPPSATCARPAHDGSIGWIRSVSSWPALNRVDGYFATTVFVAEPPRLLLTVMLPGFDGQLNSPR